MVDLNIYEYSSNVNLKAFFSTVDADTNYSNDVLNNCLKRLRLSCVALLCNLVPKENFQLSAPKLRSIFHWRLILEQFMIEYSIKVRKVSKSQQDSN